MHILGAHFGPEMLAIWGRFGADLGPISRPKWLMFPVELAIIGHQQQPRVRVIILVYVHQWPFRATGAPSVCNLPKGQIAHTAQIALKGNLR